MKIGIIGAENTHTAAIAHTLNVKGALKNASVDYVWGETEAFARAAAKKGNIPNIVVSPREMVGHVDGVVVDHRHARHHLKAARPFLDAGIPIFVDKPFCFRASEGKAFLQEARRRNVPVTSFSTLPLQRTFSTLKRRAEDIGDLVGGAFFGPCDLQSPYGGVFFYGSHQVEMALALCGDNVTSVQVCRHRECSTGQLFYPAGATVTLHFFKNTWVTFHASVVGTEGICQHVIKNDRDPHMAGIRVFTRMFKTRREPRKHSEIMRSIQVLEALRKSARSSRRERVAKPMTSLD